MKKKEQNDNINIIIKHDKQYGNQTIYFKNSPSIKSFYSIVGPKEGKGPYKKYFDQIVKDDTFGEKTFEMAERKFVETAIKGAIAKANFSINDIDMILSGDLLNQIISSSFAARTFDTAYLGLFGACSTMAESLAVGALLVDGGYFNNVVCSTVSHFSSAERQFRYPLELGNQRTPASQWTVTGSGACVLSANKKTKIKVKCATFGKVVDYGITDVNNMGAAMAPAAMSTALAHFKDTKRDPSYYDLVVTGDLGVLGSEIFLELMEQNGIKINNHFDCGIEIFDEKQETFMGGSGCGCSASMLNSYILQKMEEGEINKILFMATGALLSTTSSQQGETIPGVAYAVAIEREG